MSMIRPIAWLAALVVALAMTGRASAQGLPTAPGSNHLWEFQPFFDLENIQHDFQFFAPPEVDDFGGEVKPHHGIYVSFDRTYVNVSRPIDLFSFGSGTQGDFTWGNRMELGYMKGDPSGWQAILWHVNGPNERFANADAQQALVAQTITQNFVIPESFDTLNQLKMSSFEFNKVWRLKPYHNGAILEPTIGYRYINLRDFFQRQSLQEVAVIPPGDEYFQKLTLRSDFENQLHGGQIGGRLFQQRGHWLLSLELKAFAFANFQSLRTINEESFLPNPDEGPVDVINPLVVGGDVNRTVFYRHATQFVFGGDIKGDASYEVTRDINLRVGFIFLDLGQGLGRGNQMRFNNQGVQMAGVTFGFTVNR